MIAALIAIFMAACLVVVALPAEAAGAAPVVAAKPGGGGGGGNGGGKPGGGGGGGSTEPVYAAVGDSFAAGVGAGSYLDTSCYRSSRSYPKLLDADADKLLAAFPACSGANTSAVIAQTSAVPAGAALVTVTVGGNDVGFADVMQNCFVLPTSTCASKIAAGGAIATSDAFAANIAAVIAAIRAKAPAARIVVAGYPLLFALSGGVNSKYAWADEVNAQTVVLNDVIERVAVANGAVFVDVEDDFAGHGIGSTAPWINDWSWFNTTAGFHPTASGYIAYAAAIRAAVPAR
ncbi:SGNH/GDSL hydrolase family protein [Microbacterium ureisolvens]|uniref:SGNH/GDSL hydrolase family protein n=1 Tax=Microbacterium ureisolvens TaxID=2781186 RepID=UPI00363BDE8A